jgi:hypothetical protein
MHETMGAAVDDLQSFDGACANTDRSEFSELPAFDEGDRINAYRCIYR